MDQNEALQRYRIFSFAIIDGYSRYPIAYQLTTGLAGGDHSKFYSAAITATLKVPDCISVDATGVPQPRCVFVLLGLILFFAGVLIPDCWGGVEAMTMVVFGNNDALEVDVDGVPVPVFHFHQTLSKRNTPVGFLAHPWCSLPALIMILYALGASDNQFQVERHWREWNQQLVQYFVRFSTMEIDGLLDPRNNTDLFCLHEIFLPVIQVTMNRHYESLKLQKKRKSTRNPAYPAGTHRRSHLYASVPSCAKAITARRAERLSAIGLSYWAQQRPASLAPRVWEVDPVVTPAGRARRARFVARKAPGTLEEEFHIFRWCTLDLSARGH